MNEYCQSLCSSHRLELRHVGPTRALSLIGRSHQLSAVGVLVTPIFEKRKSKLRDLRSQLERGDLEFKLGISLQSPHLQPQNCAASHSEAETGPALQAAVSHIKGGGGSFSQEGDKTVPLGDTQSMDP